MPVEGQWDRANAPVRGLTGRERRVFGLVTGLVALGSAGVVAWGVAAGGDRSSSPGCVDLFVGSTTGAARVHACGEDGLRLCRRPAPTNATLAARLAEACARAGHPLPRSS